MKALLKKDIGIIFCIIFCSIFITVSNILKPYFDGAYWYIVSRFEGEIICWIDLW